VVSPEVAKREGGDSDDGSATVTVAARETVAVATQSSRCWSGQNLQREMEEKQRARGRKGFAF